MTRGEVWWVELPERRRRPYVVLTRTAALPVLTSVVAAACTRTKRGIPTETPLDESDGMPAPCVASFDNVETLPRWAFVERITLLGAARQAALCTAMRIALDC